MLMGVNILFLISKAIVKSIDRKKQGLSIYLKHEESEQFILIIISVYI